MVEQSFLSRFSINSPNRYVLYLAGISFLLSLISPLHGLETAVVQKGALIFIVVGLINWVFETIKLKRFDIIEAKADEDGYLSSSTEDELIAWTVFEYIILIVSYIIGAIIVF